jgi:hypothetical protein
LFWRLSERRAVRLENDAGTLPVNLLEERSRAVRSDSWPNEEGILPLTRLVDNPRFTSLVNDPMDVGRENGPIELRPRYRDDREVRVNRDEGILPVSELQLRYNTCKPVDDPIFNGRVETIELNDKSNHVKEVRVNREDGILPAIRLALIARDCK